MQISYLSTTPPKQFVSNTFDDVTSRVKNSGFTLATGFKSYTNVTSDLHVRYINLHVRYILHYIILLINRLTNTHRTGLNPEKIEKYGKVKARGETSVKPDVSSYLPDCQDPES